VIHTVIGLVEGRKMWKDRKRAGNEWIRNRRRKAETGSQEH